MYEEGSPWSDKAVVHVRGARQKGVQRRALLLAALARGLDSVYSITTR